MVEVRRKPRGWMKTLPAAASTAPSMSISPTSVPPTPATLRPTCSSMPDIVTALVFDDRLRLHAANLVDQARIIGREAGDLGLDPALGQAAAQPLDQPGAEGIEFRHLRDVDEDVGPAAAELLGVGHQSFQHRGKAGRPRACRAQRKPVTAGDPLQSRVSVHDACPPASSSSMQKIRSGTPHCLVDSELDHDPVNHDLVLIGRA